MSVPARSNLFSTVLAAQMQEAKANQVELARRTGISVSRINNYLRGNYATVTVGHAESLAALAPPGRGAALIEAYLMDLVPEECRRWVEIRYPGMPAGLRWNVPAKGLPPEFAGQFAELYRLCVSSARVRERTKEWIAIMRESCRPGRTRQTSGPARGQGRTRTDAGTDPEPAEGKAE